MKLYTRSGDDGTTGLFGGDRVAKDDPRVAAYGTVDELNATLGLVIAGCSAEGGFQGFPGRVREMLTEIQSRLFDLGADLATPAGSAHESKIHRLPARAVTDAERCIDEIDGGNDPMHSFVLPGGTELAARLHLARAICRRAERRVITLAARDPVNSHTIVYLNRLSDLLFALARRANKEAGVPDVPWQKG